MCAHACKCVHKSFLSISHPGNISEVFTHPVDKKLLMENDSILLYLKTACSLVAKQLNILNYLNSHKLGVYILKIHPSIFIREIIWIYTMEDPN